MRINAASGDRRGGRARVRHGGLWQRRRRRPGTGTGSGSARPASSAKAESGSSSSSASRPTSPASACRPAATYEGFDIEIAKIIAKGLGVDEAEHRVRDDGVGQPRALHPAGHGRRRGGDLHDQRRAQDRRSTSPARTSSPARTCWSRPTRRSPARSQLAGKKVCSVDRLDPGQADQGRSTRTRSCSSSTPTPSASTALAGGQVDAVTTDDIILAGYASQRSTRASSRWSASRSPRSRTASA